MACSTVLMGEAQILLLVNEIQPAVTAQPSDTWRGSEEEAASDAEAFTESAEISRRALKHQCLPGSCGGDSQEKGMEGQPDLPLQEGHALQVGEEDSDGPRLPRAACAQPRW